ncbi:hypothetical protein [Gordonia zhaorongruii]|uniref:hypothetical protein n=1 Tax=Gordonia zhaorongruii TaxID=2597659 RepID=UPI00104F13BC|nr:hypothetical protein [Gordonia zhaorongruii]
MWASIEETLARIDSMDAGAAAADAAELRRIVAAAAAVAGRLSAAFAPTDGLSGRSAEGASAAGAALATRIESASQTLSPGSAALDGASAALDGSIASRDRVAALGRLEAEFPELRVAVVGTLNGLMGVAYNSPMSASAGSVSAAGGPESGSGGRRGSATVWSAVAGGPVAGVATSGAGYGTGLDGSTSAAGVPEPVGLPVEQPVGRSADPVVSPGTSRNVATDGSGSGGHARFRGGGSGAGGGSGPAGPAGGGPSRSPVGSAHAGRADPVAISGEAIAPPSGAVLSGMPPTMPMTGFAGGGPVTPRAGLPGAAMRNSGAGGTGLPSAAASPPPTSSRPSAPAGGYPSGAARRRDDETSRGPADYLRSTREGELLLGAQPLVTPPVLPPRQNVMHGAEQPGSGNSSGDEVEQELDPTL